jgi:hypothetical protein
MDRRHSRQARLKEVGAEGQRRLERATVCVSDDGLRARVEALYLRGAGVAVSSVGSLRADDEPAWVAELSPAARAVASGAHGALVAVRAILDGASHPRVSPGSGSSKVLRAE